MKVLTAVWLLGLGLFAMRQLHPRGGDPGPGVTVSQGANPLQPAVRESRQILVLSSLRHQSDVTVEFHIDACSFWQAAKAGLFLCGASWVSASVEQRGEFPRGNDPRGFVAAEREQFLAAGHQIVGLAGFGKRQ
jgi:hypothetical protein